MPFDTSHDRAGPLRGRNPEGAFTEGAERANVVSTNAITDGLIARKGEMAKQCKAQLGDLFENAENSYGRARAVGMSAGQASKLVERAFGE